MFDEMMAFLNQRVYKDDDRSYVALFMAEIMAMNHFIILSSPGLHDFMVFAVCNIIFVALSIGFGLYKREQDWTHPLQATMIFTLTTLLMMGLNAL